jgi:transposase
MKNELSQLSTVDLLKWRYHAMQPLDEATKRRWAGIEALTIGRGGENLVFEATGISRTTIRKGMNEVREKTDDDLIEKQAKTRIRTPGGGRKSLVTTNPAILAILHSLLEPVTSGDPMNNNRWTSASTYKLADQLNSLGYKISPDSVGNLLKSEGYSLQANLKSIEGEHSADRDYQFEFINKTIEYFKEYNQPIISIDAKKKELVGNFANKGKEWHKKQDPIKVNVYDFIDLGEGKVTPFGVYDINYNEGLVNLGITHDTAEFAAESVKKWWFTIGIQRYNNSATKLLILSDGGGSNSSRSRLWKFCLQDLANTFKIPIYVSHYPPGTSKYNKIEHRMFSYISINWRGKPLLSFRVVLNLIANTTTNTGLKIHSILDDHDYQIGKKVTNEEFDSINITYTSDQNKLNYCIKPNKDNIMA